MHDATENDPIVLRREITRLRALLAEARQRNDLLNHENEQYLDAWLKQGRHVQELRARLEAAGDTGR